MLSYMFCFLSRQKGVFPVHDSTVDYISMQLDKGFDLIVSICLFLSDMKMTLVANSVKKTPMSTSMQQILKLEKFCLTMILQFKGKFQHDYGCEILIFMYIQSYDEFSLKGTRFKGIFEKKMKWSNAKETKIGPIFTKQSVQKWKFSKIFA